MKPKYCPYCGRPLEDWYRFCPSCGKSLEELERLPEAVVGEEAPSRPPAPTATPPQIPGRFTLSMVPPSAPYTKEQRYTVRISGVSPQFVFNGSKTRKVGKLRLNEALQVFAALPRDYPRPLSRKDSPVGMVVDGREGVLKMVLKPRGSRKRVEEAYFVWCHVAPLSFYELTLFDGATYEEVVQAISRLYRESEFLRNAFKAKEQFIRDSEIREGKYLDKLLGHIMLYYADYEDFRSIPTAIYTASDGFLVWIKATGGEELPPPQELVFIPFERVREVKASLKSGEMKIKFFDEKGKKQEIEFRSLSGENVGRCCQILMSFVPDRLRVK